MPRRFLRDHFVVFTNLLEISYCFLQNLDLRIGLKALIKAA